jgi:hypothetical protein
MAAKPNQKDARFTRNCKTAPSLSPLVFGARSLHQAEAANIINGIIFRAFSGACGNLVCGV